MIEPLEKTNPDLAAAFMAIARDEIPALIHCGRVFEVHGFYKKTRRVPLTQRIKREIKFDLGRNDPCHCGSGKKYKKCCLNLEA